jgi:hypothetical protein
MSAVRVRTPGNNPETRIFCDGGDYLAGGSPCRSLPMVDWDAREARKRAKQHGWVKVGKKDYCAGCWPTAARRTAAK